MSYDKLVSLFEDGTLETSSTYDLETEEKALRHFSDTVCEDDVFLDVGAHVGIYSLIAAMNDAKIIAVEPSDRPRKHLLHNLKQLNADCEVIDAPVAKEAGEISFVIDADGGTSSIIETSNMYDKKVEQDGTKIVTRTAITIPELLQHYNPTIVKTDIEGAENDIIPTLTLEDNLPEKMYCEIHRDDPQPTINALQELGEVTILHKREFTCQTFTETF